MKLKVMTYNIASGYEGGVNREKLCFEPMVDTVTEYMPDILGLNEVRAKYGEFTQQDAQLAEALGYKYSFFARAIDVDGGGYGNGLVSKFPILSAEIIPIPDPSGRNPELAYEELEDGFYYETRCLLKATILAENEELDVFVTHFGLAPMEKENMMKVLKELIPGRKNKCILMGDFNCTPESEQIKALEELLLNAQPDEITAEFYTYASYDPNRKIDYIMVSKDIKTEAFGAIDSQASDHRPYFAEIEI